MGRIARWFYDLWTGRSRPGRLGKVDGVPRKRPERMELYMSRNVLWTVGGIILGLILLAISPWLALGVIVAALVIPTGAYLMLDPKQRRRLRGLRRRQLGD